MKVSVYIAASLDGFIARRNGDLDWLCAGDGGEDYGYAEFISGIDHIVMGRNTYIPPGADPRTGESRLKAYLP